jgi:P2-related tail formation protein
MRGYQNNPLVSHILEFADERIRQTGIAASQLHTKLEPTTTDSKYLDWLAYMVGAVDGYWSSSWSDGVKRIVLTNWQRLTEYRGTRIALELALSAHSIPYVFWSSSDVALPFSLPVTLGVVTYSVFVTLPLSLARNSYEFIEARRAVDNYTAAAYPVVACYDRFYAGISAVGEPLF